MNTLQFRGLEMDSLAQLIVTVAAIIAFYKLFLGRRRRRRGSDNSNPETSLPSDSDDSNYEISLRSDSTPDSGGSDSYEVFLSFRGPDTRHYITDILYRFLARSKIRTFKDDEELRVGEGIWPNLAKAIHRSKISIPIFSHKYAHSKYCLKELVEITEHREREKGHIILPIFYMVDPGDVRHQTGPFYENAFKVHKENNIDETTLRSWRRAMKIVGELKGWHIVSKKEEAAVADLVSGAVWSHLIKNNYALETDELVGIDDQVERVVDRLNLGSQGVDVVGLHGIGGIGKTTIATAVYNKLSSSFDRYSFVENIREAQHQKGGVLAVQKKFISNILGKDSVRNVVGIAEAKKIIRDRISQFKILVVLDDVDEKFKFKEVLGDPENFLTGSRFIVTSRIIEVLKGPEDETKLYEIQGMDSSRSLQLFCKHAFRKNSPLPGFEVLSKKIISTTGGLPLTLKVVGSLLLQKEKPFG